MLPEENKAVVRPLFGELINQGNPTATNEVIAADYVDHSPIPAPGPEGFGQHTVMLRAAFVGECVFGELLAEDDLVALSGINVERIKDGKIVDHWSQFDLAGRCGRSNPQRINEKTYE
jgi:predicted SnoaL-like aldol condensation-catalyzing enzyme